MQNVLDLLAHFFIFFSSVYTLAMLARGEL